MKFKNLLYLLLSVSLVSFAVTGCDEDTTPVDSGDPDVSPPTNVRAASADGAVLLTWDASVSESQTNFGSYDITVLNQTTQTSTHVTAAKGATSYRVDGLTNGTRYLFSMRSVTSAGKQSTGVVTIEWAPAFRHSQDAMNNVIRVYNTSSSKNSAIDLHNSAGKAEVIAQAGAEFRARGDLYVTPGTSNALLMKSPAEANNKGEETQFSTETAQSDKLDDQLATAPPPNSTYTLKEVTVGDLTVQTGKVYFGRIVRGSDFYYFRILVKKGSNNKLIQGSDPDRNLELVVSFQNDKNVPFAKR